MQKKFYTNVKIKELFANKDIQKVLKELVEVPKIVLIKQVKNPFTNKDTNETTQKIHAVSGTSLTDMIEIDFTIVGNEPLDAVYSINKYYQIDDYTMSMEANMRGGKFNGYSATGLKILVTKLSEVKKTGN
ncbi:hypothetical protein [Streptococcus uberis]|uniref:hypothetical protein n=1 Tax=Streptococcus uberis TaxID=1349 RepID=UPI0012B50538|nr:hypothetical protein [Streptococcus uberis]MTB36807.1 hypothetical protein [Streptococcus uberis]MTB57789.1 hypothetical protein [Streptococcus uberis]